MSFNLLVESIDRSNFNYIVEEGSKDQPGRVYIEGPYMVAEKINKNKRVFMDLYYPIIINHVTTNIITMK
mgnify:CR=1 FL=1